MTTLNCGATRRAITSGNLDIVPDKSAFMKHILKELRNVRKGWICAANLFVRIRDKVADETKIRPQYGKIIDTGDEGVDFIFIRRR